MERLVLPRGIGLVACLQARGNDSVISVAYRVRERSAGGFFADTHAGPVSLLHVDCDLYSATKTVLRYLGHRLVAGSIILFDEYLNYPGWRHHEFKAFQEYIAWSGQRYEYLSVVTVHQQVAVRILD